VSGFPGALDDHEFDTVRDYLRSAAGLEFDAGRRGGLAAVVADRLQTTGAESVRSYLASLDGPGGEVERQRLLDAVTVQETHFFRNAPQMEVLRRRVLPELLRRAAGRERPLTIWSAGCSTGEEPYTLAMLLLELSPGAGGNAGRERVRILGTDVSAEALRTAERATYAGRTVDSLPTMVRDRWLEPVPGGALTVRDEVRQLVELRMHNLVTDPVPLGRGEVDLVVCRNVTIYFGRDTTRLLMGSFHDVLAEGGYLLLGHSETLWQVSDAFTLVPVGEAFVYRRSHQTRRLMVPGARLVRRLRPAPPARGLPATPASARPPLTPASPLLPPLRVDPASTAPRNIVASTVPPPRSVPLADSRGVPDLDAAVAALQAGDYATAARHAQAALETDPLLPIAYVVLGQARSTLGQDAGAVDPLRKAVYLDPTAGQAHFLLAGALSRLGQHGPAAVSYRAAAAALGKQPGSALAGVLDGRDVGELAALCLVLAEQSERQVGGELSSSPGGAG
jgi:chemotaxis protein methyltransferase CheR